jgi:GNAT superfamily N-acetyltransferase
MQAAAETAVLPNGQTLSLLRVEPPAGALLPTLDAAWSRGPAGFGALVTRSLKGDLLDQTRDLYLFGELEGRIVARMGCIRPAPAADVGTYGFVFTHPEHRRKGIASALLDALLRVFEEQGGVALHLATLNPAAHDLYRKHGFEDLGTPRIMRYVCGRHRADDFEHDYFAHRGPAFAREAHWGDYPRLEALYSVMSHPWLLRDYPRGVWRGDRKNAYEDEGLQALEQQAARKGATLVLENPARHVVGAASFTIGSLCTGRVAAEFDLLVMPAYFEEIPALLEALERQALLLAVERL